MTTAFRSTSLAAPGALLAVLAALASCPAMAQYKVVGPDGKVTYTDRPPISTENTVTSLGARGPAVAEVALPLELRQPISRYPVTLYVASGICEPCDTGRQLLHQRGVPHAEKQVQTVEDADALERLSGGRDAPVLTIGTQTLRGFAPEVWTSYLDAAGYPRESRLPANFQYAAATPLTERREAKVPAAQPRATKAAQPQASAPPTTGASGIKF